MAPSCYCTRLRLATRKVSAVYDAVLSPLGINIAQYALLRSIARAQPVSLTELGRLTELDRSTIGRNVRVLERMDLVTTARGEDLREASVRLSQQGEQVLQRAEPLWQESQDTIEARLGKDRIRVLDEILEAL